VEGVYKMLPLYVLLGGVSSYVAVLSSYKCNISIKVS
jgi:hypothetical protein